MEGELTDDEKAYYGAYEDLFQSKGWSLLAGELQREVEALPLRAFQAAKSYEDLQTGRAKAQAILELLAMPAMIENAKQSTIAARQAQVADDE